MTLSVVIPAHNEARLLAAALVSVREQMEPGDELLVVDDASSDETAQIAGRLADQVVRLPAQSGPAIARNRGLEAARGDTIAFMDGDCVALPGWLASIRRLLAEMPRVGVVMGRITIQRSTFIGDCIASLGFPAGGHVGFEKMWRVAPDGRTDHISSGNFAVRRSVVEAHGAFDETFGLRGSEDAELSIRWHRAGVFIRFSPEACVAHEPWTDLRAYLRGQVSRGRNNYHFQQRVGDVGPFIRLRLWSSLNVLRHSLLTPRFPVVFALLATSFVLQKWGQRCEARAARKA